jgi:hypothetical protein
VRPTASASGGRARHRATAPRRGSASRHVPASRHGAGRHPALDPRRVPRSRHGSGPRHVPAFRRTWPALLAIAGILLLAGAGWVVVRTTSAAFADHGELRSGYSGAFSIGAVDAEGIVHLPVDDVITGRAADVEGFAPGGTAEVPVDLFNNSAAGRGEITTSVQADSDLADQFRYSAWSVSAGRTTVLFGDPEDPSRGVPADQIPPVLEMSLAPRDAEPLEDGVAWTGPEESRAEVVVAAHLLDSPESSAASSVHTTLTITMQGKTP